MYVSQLAAFRRSAAERRDLGPVSIGILALLHRVSIGFDTKRYACKDVVYPIWDAGRPVLEDFLAEIYATR